MTYQPGSPILASDLNGFLDTTNNIYGVGTSDRGYGQSTYTQDEINPGNVVRSSHWDNLWQMIAICGSQQGTDVSGFVETDVNAGHSITFQPDLPDIVTSIDTNRLNVSLSSLSVAAGVWTVTRGTSWTVTITSEISTTWADEDHARWYFNSGGQVRMTGSHPTGTAQDNAWHTSLATGLGTVKFAAHATTNTGSFSGATSVGYYGLTDSYQNIFSGHSAGGGTYYAQDNIVIQAKRLNHIGTRGGNGNGVQFKITLTDTGSYYTGTVASGTAFSFDNVKATTFLSGIASPTYATISGF